MTEVVLRVAPPGDQVIVRLPKRQEGWTREQAITYALSRVKGTVLEAR